MAPNVSLSSGSFHSLAYQTSSVHWKARCIKLCTKWHSRHVKTSWFCAHTVSYSGTPSPSLDVAISPYCNSAHTSFPRQQWMAWLGVRAQQASIPNRDKISLFLSKLHNGSGGERKRKKERNRHFSPLRLSRHKTPSEIWLQHLRKASLPLLGMTCRFVPCSPQHAALLHFFFYTPNRLLRIHGTVAAEYAKQQDCFRLQAWTCLLQSGIRLGVASPELGLGFGGGCEILCESFSGKYANHRYYIGFAIQLSSLYQEALRSSTKKKKNWI